MPFRQSPPLQQPQSREDIEDMISDCEYQIKDYKYHLRWYTRAIWTFWISLFFTIFLILLQSIISIPPSATIITLSVIITISAGIVYMVPFFIENQQSPLHRSTLKNYRKDQQELQKRRIRLIQQLKRYDTRTFQKKPYHEQYKQALPDLISSYRKRSSWQRRLFITIQICIIILSASITSLSGGWITQYVKADWLVPVFSAVISILTSMSLFFKFREKSANLQQTADAMDLELNACQLGIGEYEKVENENKRAILLSKRAEALRKEQQQRQQQLEQSSQDEQKAMHKNT